MDARRDPTDPRVTLGKRSEEVNEQLRRNEEARDALRKVYARVANTEDGKAVFDHIRKLCGHNLSPLRILSNGVSNELSWALQGRIEVYLDIRPFLPAKVVSEIEQFVEPKSEGK